MAVRLIAIDIDGTLLDSQWKLPEANRAAIVEATRRGIEVALVTGRRYDFAMPVARRLECPLTMIINNGALIRSQDGHTHLRHLLPRDTARRVLDATRTWRDEAALRAAEFAVEYALAVTVYESRDFSMIDVINPACSKGAALAEWAGLRRLAREEVMAIGDNHNDVEMLSFAGRPVVMGNSVPELKSFGWHETLSNDDAGVAAAIAHFAFEEAPECA